jgi:hypothetical protein
VSGVGLLDGAHANGEILKMDTVPVRGTLNGIKIHMCKSRETIPLSVICYVKYEYAAHWPFFPFRSKLSTPEVE